ncbi:MAG: hypothetical protein KBC72_00425 [Acinetobacter sp.]|nr:hypothetical protein [Acinetobacter sp.]
MNAFQKISEQYLGAVKPWPCIVFTSKLSQVQLGKRMQMHDKINANKLGMTLDQYAFKDEQGGF